MDISAASREASMKDNPPALHNFIIVGWTLPAQNRQIQLLTMGTVHPAGILLVNTKRQQGLRAGGKKEIEGEAAMDSGF